jgi:arylformamidase
MSSVIAINPSLDQLYNNRAAVPEHPQIFSRWREQAAATRATLKCELNLAYGADAKQTIDLFPAKANRGLAVFIHGGYWRALDKDDFSFIAEPLVAAGISVALVNYRLCPTVTVADITEDCRQAIAWLVAKVGKYGIGSDRMMLIGHSAGAHLVAMMYATDWSKYEVMPYSFRGGMALSGLYDLGPLLETAVNADLKLDAASAKLQSPIHLKSSLTVPLEMVVGAAETSEFIRQSQLLPRWWQRVATAVEAVPGMNHFTIVDHFADPATATFKRALRVLE